MSSLVLLSGVGYIEDNCNKGRCVDLDMLCRVMWGIHLGVVQASWWMSSWFNIDIGLGSKSEEASLKVSDAGYSLSSIPIETIWGMPTAYATLGFLCWLDRVLLTWGALRMLCSRFQFFTSRVSAWQWCLVGL